MGSGASSARSLVLQAARAAAEGAVLAAGAALVAGLSSENPATVRLTRVGLSAAWAASALSVAWLIGARGRSWKAFWWAFGGGMALRAATLGALTWWSWGRGPAAMQPLLLSYVFGLMGLLLALELRHLRIR